jgi:hypothetical protein
MELHDFTGALTTLCNFYERKEPRQATMELWFKLVQRIPSEPISWIIKKIEETHDSFPKNVTSAFWGSYGEWQQTNPDKIKQQEFFDCPDCNEGLIFANKIKNGNNYRYVFRCVKCKQNHCRSYPFASRLELKEDGYDVTPKAGNLSNGKKYKSTREMAAVVGIPIPPMEITEADIPF